MSRLQTMHHVILPQAVLRVLPALASTWVSLFKDTSLVSTIAVADLSFVSLKLRAGTYRILEVLTAMAVLYWLMGYPQAKLVEWVHRRFQVDGGRIVFEGSDVASPSANVRRVAPGNFTPRPSQNRTYASRHIRLVSSTEGCRLPSGPAAPPVSRWPLALTQMTPSLRSVGITPPHRYYGGVRNSAPHRYSRLAVFAACASPFHIGATGSCSSARKPASASRPLYAGRRLPSNQAPDKLIPR